MVTPKVNRGHLARQRRVWPARQPPRSLQCLGGLGGHHRKSSFFFNRKYSHLAYLDYGDSGAIEVGWVILF